MRARSAVGSRLLGCEENLIGAAIRAGLQAGSLFFDGGYDRLAVARPCMRYEPTVSAIGISKWRQCDSLTGPQHPASSAAVISMTSAEFLDKRVSLPLLYQPGTVGEYGFSTDVLGLVVESITNQTLGKYLQENLFKPLGMSDADRPLLVGPSARLKSGRPNVPQHRNEIPTKRSPDVPGIPALG